MTLSQINPRLVSLSVKAVLYHNPATPAAVKPFVRTYSPDDEVCVVLKCPNAYCTSHQGYRQTYVNGQQVPDGIDCTPFIEEAVRKGWTEIPCGESPFVSCRFHHIDQPILPTNTCDGFAMLEIRAVYS